MLILKLVEEVMLKIPKTFDVLEDNMSLPYWPGPVYSPVELVISIEWVLLM